MMRRMSLVTKAEIFRDASTGSATGLCHRSSCLRPVTELVEVSSFLRIRIPHP